VDCRGLVRRAWQDVPAHRGEGGDKFARDLALEPDYQLTFLYEGDGEMIVMVFNDTSCRRHYHTSESGSDNDS
jgi:hypothetical protein